MEKYREQIIIAIQDMITARHNLEPYTFTMNHFRGVEDPNVLALIKLCDLIESKIFILMEENDIDYNDVNFEL